MEDFIVLVKAGLKYLLSYLPTALPSNQASWDSWKADILELGGWPDNDSFDQALAAQIMHLGPTTTRVPKQLFIKVLQKSINNQQAYSVIEGVRERQKALLGNQQVQTASAKLV